VKNTIIICALVAASGLLLAAANMPLSPSSWILDAALKMNGGCRSGVCSWLSTEVELKRHAAKDNSP